MAPALDTKISGHQVVGSSAAALINLGCGRIDQFAVRIEGAEQPGLIGPRIGLNSPQRFGIDEKRRLHGAIVSPKPHGAPRCVIKAALIRKAKRHCANPARRESRDSPCCRTGGEFPGCYISPRRLRDTLPEEPRRAALRSRTGWRRPHCQTVCSQWAVAWISACGWGTAPPRRHNRIRPWLVQARPVRPSLVRPSLARA